MTRLASFRIEFKLKIPSTHGALDNLTFITPFSQCRMYGVSTFHEEIGFD